MSKLREYIKGTIDNRGRNPEYYLDDGDFPVIDNYMIQNNYYLNLITATRYIDQYLYKSFIRDYIYKDMVVMTLVGNGIGNVALIPNDQCVIIQNTIGFDTKDSLDDKFLYYYFQHIKPFIKALDRGSSQPSILQGDILNLDIDIPDIQTQICISRTLSTIDDKIVNNNAICTDLEAMAKLLYDYWFVQFDFPDENGKPYKSSGGKMVWNEDLKREIPEGWEVKPLGDVFSFVKGRIPDYLSNTSDEDYTSPYITIDVANNGLPQYCNPKSMVACNGEVIMVMDGAASGDVYLGNIGSLGSTFSMLPSKRDDISNALIYMFLKANMAIYKRANTGSTVPHANRSFIEKMKVCLPANASYMSKEFNLLFNKLILSRTENQQLASLRDFLLPMLMNGQVKVGGKGDLPPVACPTDETRGEYMVAAEPQKAYDAEGKGV